jgi:hypothetical protein
VSKIVRVAACGLLIANVVVLQGQTPKDAESRNTVAYLCGNLVHVDSRRAEKWGTTYHTSPLPNVLINLYPRDKKPCCGNLKAVEQITSGTGGEFAFRKAKPRTYWFVTTIGGHEFKLPLQLVRPNAISTTCRNQEFEIEDSGNIRILRMVGYL